MMDIDEIQKEEYAKQGIYYYVNETNMMTGILLVWGPEDTLYENMPMCYFITFPHTYPFDPPKAEFITSDGSTRFHPNMYVDGKVCLSILGTWEGPKWTGILRLSSVGVILQSIMDNNPVVHEPGCATRTDSYVVDYNEFVGSKVLDFLTHLVLTYIDTKSLPNYLKPFESIFVERIQPIVSCLEKRLEEKIKTGEKFWSQLIYRLSGSTNYKRNLELLEANRTKIDELINSASE
jgi:ubiquitin-protein ligase